MIPSLEYRSPCTEEKTEAESNEDKWIWEMGKCLLSGFLLPNQIFVQGLPGTLSDMSQNVGQFNTVIKIFTFSFSVKN